jgi:hypothetical protein
MQIDPVILGPFRQAQAVLASCIEPGGPGEADAINALLWILDNEPLIRAGQSRSSAHRDGGSRARTEPPPVLSRAR